MTTRYPLVCVCWLGALGNDIVRECQQRCRKIIARKCRRKDPKKDMKSDWPRVYKRKEEKVFSTTRLSFFASLLFVGIYVSIASSLVCLFVCLFFVAHSLWFLCGRSGSCGWRRRRPATKKTQIGFVGSFLSCVLFMRRFCDACAVFLCHFKTAGAVCDTTERIVIKICYKNFLNSEIYLHGKVLSWVINQATPHGVFSFRSAPESHACGVTKRVERLAQRSCSMHL
jgi:hypothetical protein